MPRDPDEILKVEEERSLRGELNSTAFSLEFLLITSEVSAPFEELVYTSEHGLEVSMAWVLVLYMVKFLGEWNLIWSALKMLPSEKSQSGHNLLCFTSLMHMKSGACSFPSLSTPLWCHFLLVLYNTCAGILISFCHFFLSFAPSWSHVHFHHHATEFCITLCWLISLQIYEHQPQLDSQPCPEIFLFFSGWLPFLFSTAAIPNFTTLLQPVIPLRLMNDQQVLLLFTFHSSTSQFICNFFQSSPYIHVQIFSILRKKFF